MASADATGCKEEGNGAMARGDFVNAMKWYSQALALNPKEAALYSNRSFAFLRLGLTARALSDADEAARRRPDWAKGHFRRAEALSQAGLHDEALRAYEMGCRCDPADEHLSAQCIEAKARQAAQRQAELTRVVAAGVLGLLVLGLLLLAPGSEAAAPKPGARAPSGALRALQAGVGLLLGRAAATRTTPRHCGPRPPHRPRAHSLPN